MPPIQIVTDSSARFVRPSFLSHPLISLAAASVAFPSESFEDSPSVSLARMVNTFQRHPSLPTSLPPSVAQFEAIYSSLQERTDQILSIHTSAALSDSLRNAQIASENFRGRCDIQLVDSHTASAGLGLLAAAAAEASEGGAGMEELVRVIRGMIARLYMVIFLDELQYLERDGLISRSQSILGSMLGIIPFLTMEHGRLIPMEKVRTRPRALEKLIEFAAEFTDIEQMIILQLGPEPDEETASVAERLQAHYADTPIHHVDYGSSLAAHVGVHGLGLVVLESEEDTL